MIKCSFNMDWRVRTGVKGPFDGLMPSEDDMAPVTLPHDAMIYEERYQNAPSGKHSGFYPAKDYTYSKEFTVPEDWRNKSIVLEFEGVAQRALVFINDEPAGNHLNPYSGFFVDTAGLLNYGAINTVKVIAANDNQNSRWYPGAGIYRDVSLHIGNSLHIVPDGVKVYTEDIAGNCATVHVDISLKNTGAVRMKVRLVTEVFSDNQVGFESSWLTAKSGGEYRVSQRFLLKDVRLWSPDHPNLYNVKVSVYEEDVLLDETIVVTGFRKLSLDAVNGLRINGEQVMLRGACIHHDNGIIGACTLEKAEEFRCCKLKEAGFNSIRSAHNPISKAMLSVCDKLGILIMDELSDMWLEPKNPHDYAHNFMDHWEDETERMVNKDYNHPSVILYSIGNEIPDLGKASGVELNRLLSNRVRALDPHRFTTNGVNAFLLVSNDMFRIMSDVTGMTPEQMAQLAETNDQPSDGSIDEMNHLIGSIPQQLLDAALMHPIFSEKINEIAGALDVIGFNYMTARYEFEHEANPNRIIVGSETFPTDIIRNWPIMQNNPHVIGDFTWTGYDYLGEAGIGYHTYPSDGGAEDGWPARVAYCGDIDLVGYRRPISYLREIVFGIRKEPYIAIERFDRHGQEMHYTTWAYPKDVVASYTWHGYEGKVSRADVFSADDEVELLINGQSLGKKPAGKEHGFTAAWDIVYEPGEITAIGYKNGCETGRTQLYTASQSVELTVEVSTVSLLANGADLSFITVKLADENGIENLQAKKSIKVKVDGTGSLQGFGSACPSGLGSYQDTECETYDGFALAVIRSGFDVGLVNVTFSAEGCLDKIVEINVQ